jgi:hypothetical protein
MARFGLTAAISAAILVFLAAASFSSASARRHPSAYFPAGELRSTEDADAAYDEWYSSLLSKMTMPDSADPAQPSLFIEPAGAARHDQEYRALISRDHEYLIAIRVWHDGEAGGRAEMVANRVDLRDPSLSQSIHRQLIGNEWSDILHNMDRTTGANAQTHPARFGPDCIDWVVESREGDRYGLRSYSCPIDPGVRRLQDAFVRASGWRPY